LRPLLDNSVVSAGIAGKLRMEVLINTKRLITGLICEFSEPKVTNSAFIGQLLALFMESTTSVI
jgi:hypothetical protein